MKIQVQRGEQTIVLTPQQASRFAFKAGDRVEVVEQSAVMSVSPDGEGLKLTFSDGQTVVLPGVVALLRDERASLAVGEMVVMIDADTGKPATFAVVDPGGSAPPNRDAASSLRDDQVLPEMVRAEQADGGLADPVLDGAARMPAVAPPNGAALELADATEWDATIPDAVLGRLGSPIRAGAPDADAAAADDPTRGAAPAGARQAPALHNTTPGANARFADDLPTGEPPAPTPTPVGTNSGSPVDVPAPSNGTGGDPAPVVPTGPASGDPPAPAAGDTPVDVPTGPATPPPVAPPSGGSGGGGSGGGGSGGGGSAPPPDTRAPKVTGVTSSTADDTPFTEPDGTIQIAVTFDENVTVDGGVPGLKLETGADDGEAKYVSGSGSNTLVYEYTVRSGDQSPDLDYLDANALVLNGATIKDAAGNDADLTLAAPGAAGSLADAKGLVLNVPFVQIPVITGLTAATDTGASPTDGITSVDLPELRGTAGAGHTVKIFEGATQIGEVVADAGGNWAFTPAAPLTEGDHRITARGFDPAGPRSSPSAEFVVAVDQTVPANPVVTGLTATSDTGTVGDGLSSLATPELAGTAEPNAIVEVLDGATSLGTTTADATGAWTFTPAAPLAEGAHVITARATDLAGNASGDSPAVTVSLDLTPPTAPAITGLAAATDTGVSDADGNTSQVRPTLQGTAQPNVTVEILDGATVLGTVAAAADGSWSFTPAADLAEGAHALTAVARDEAGNVSPASPAFTATIDTTAPTGESAVALDPASDLGASSVDGVTSVATPTITGTSDPGATVQIFDSATPLGIATADGTGAWTFTPAAPLAAGAHAITSRATDLAGNLGPVSPAFAVTIDLTAPVAPVVTGLAPGSDTGASTSDGLTNLTTPTLRGTAEANATVEVFAGATSLGTTTAAADGSWTLTPGAALPAGVHAITARATDLAGNLGPASPATSITVDPDAPAAPTLAGLSAATDSGGSAVDGVTNVVMPTFTGTAEAGATVTLVDVTGATPVTLGTAVAAGDGSWAITPAAALAEGALQVVARATDAAGNTGADSGAFTATIDTTAPPAPAQPSLTVATDAGASSTDGVTNVDTPTIAGTADPGATVEVFDGALSLGTTTADGGGAWTLTPAAPLADGPHAITARATDLAGNQGPASVAGAVTIDLAAPAAPAVTGLAPGSDTGPSATDGATNVATPGIVGTAEAGATVEVRVDGVAIGTATADAGGTWSFTPAAAIADGSHAVTAIATDVAGNQGAASAAFTLVVDASAPAAPAISGLTAATDTGASDTDGVTMLSTPTIAGTAEADATVEVLDGATSLGTTTADGAGAWTFTPAAPLAAGAHSFTARATDAAGNQGAASPAFAVSIDDTAPVAPTVTGLAPASDTGTSSTDGLTTIEQPEIVGTAEANATVEVFSGATSLGTTTADAGGAWSFTPAAPLAGGLHTITARAVDLAGNQGAASTGYLVVIDATPPDPPVITGLTAATDAGVSSTDAVTNVATPAITGTTRPFATVEVFDNSPPTPTSLGTATADLSGAWTVTLATPLAEGVHALTARAVSASGLAGGLSPVRTVTIDLTPPVTPTLAGLAPGSDTGVSGTDGLTGNVRPTFAGTATPGAIVQVLDGGAPLGATTADAAGNWALTPAAPLAAGAHAITARAADVAGNLSAATAPVTVTIDATAPAAPVITGLAAATDTGASDADGITQVAAPTLVGTAEADATVEIFDGATSLGTTTTDGSGAWSFTPAAALADGAHAITAVARDAAGNVGPSSAPMALTVDGAAPGAPTIFGLAPGSDTGVSALDGLTADATPTLTGSAEPGATIAIRDGATALGTTTADALGQWSFTPTADLPAGAHAFTAVATDAAGNAGPATAPFLVTIDLAAPAAPTITGLDPATDTGPDASDSLTFNDRPTLVGTAEPGARLEVFDNSPPTPTSLGFATADGSGAWAFTPRVPLAQGAHAFTAQARDDAGNASPASAVKTITVDAAPPGAPTFDGLTAATDTGASGTDGITANAMPTLAGTAVAGAAVEVYDGATLLGTATADAGGNWLLALAAPLAEGSHVIGVRAADAAGNKGAFQAARTIVVDTTAPAAATIAGLTPASDTGASATDGVTSAARPTLVGTAEPGGRVEVFDGATSLGTASVDPTGRWSFTPTTDLAAGAHAFTAVAIDDAGNAGPASIARLITRDDASPAAPTITGLTAATDTGADASDRVTRDARPVVAGTAEPGAEVRVFLDAPPAPILLGTTTADGTGAWTLALGAPLPAGAHALTARAVDTAGNMGAASGPVTVTIDVTAPAAPAIAGLTAATDTGASDNDGITANAAPTLRGTAEPGATVEIFDGGASLGTATADGAGAWTLTPAAPLAGGPHVLTAVATDAAGNVGPASAPIPITIDATAPGAPTILGLTAATDTGASNTDGITGNPAPTLRGTAEPGATVVIKDGATAIATTTADGTGRWSVGLTLTAGAHTLTAEATDAAGNVGAASAPRVITLDTSAPAAPTGLALGAGTDLGASATDGVTANVRPLIVGLAEPNAAVAIFDGAPPTGTLLGTATADAAGNWAFAPAVDLAAGTHAITARATDVVGNVGPASAAMTVTIVVTAPGAPTVTGLTAASDTGASSTDGLTSVATPTLQGTAAAGATVAVYDGATPLGTTTADGAGAWAFTPAAALASGSHTITATATDLAGNQSGTSAPLTIVIDADAPAAPLVAGLTAATDTGVSDTDGVTGLATPTIVGTAEPGATVKVYDGTALIGTVTADATGSWSLVPAALAEGAHPITATATDAVGNVSLPSAVRTIAVDTTISAVPTVTGLAAATDTGASDTDGVTGNRTPTIVGTAEPDSAVTVFDGGVALGTTTADGTGAWSLTPAAPLAEGAHSITAEFTDRVGNASGLSAPKAITIDAAAPGVPTLAGLAAASDTGASNTDGVTADATPTLVGTAEAGATVRVFDLTPPTPTLIGSATADGAGNWSFTPAAALADGPHALSVAVEDAAGNLSEATAPLLVTVDTTNPGAPVVTGLTAATDTGRSATDAITSHATPTIVGTAEAGATVAISDGATVLGTATADARGAWAFTPGAPLAAGPHAITARAIDLAGNAGAASAVRTVTVDQAAPAAAVVTGLTAATDTGNSGSDALTANATPTIAGTAEAGATVRVFDGATLLGATVADAGGNWTFAVPAALTPGAHAITAVAADAAGNAAAASAAKAVTVDVAAPAAPVVTGLTPATDTGASSTDGQTTNAAPTFRGTAEANALVTVYDGATALGTVQVDGAGAWTFTPASDLAQGGHAITAVATDLAGNASPPSAPYATTIDGAAPGAPVITGLTAATDTGLYDTDRITTVLKPTLVGTAEAGATIKVFDGAAQIGATTADATGAWSFTPAANLAQGAHVITVTATDATGSASVASAAVTVTVDTAAPAAPVITGLTAATDTGTSTTDALTANARPAIAGTAEANATVEVFEGATSLGKTAADATGAWTLTPATAFLDGAHALTARATDAAGNVSAASAAKTVTVDLSAPGTPVVTGLTAATDTGTSTADGVTANASPAIQGTADANAKVQVFDGTTLLGTATANGAGAWTFTPAAPLAAGSHTITAASVDDAGNASALATPVAVLIDATAPAAPVISGLAAGQDTGPNGEDGGTNSATPTLVGTAEAGATVKIFEGAALKGAVTADAAGAWSFTFGTALAAGAHTFTATATDAAGNASAASAGKLITVDATAPASPVITGVVASSDSGPVSTDGVTNDSTPTIAGTAEANAQVKIFDGGTLIGTVAADGTGAWSFTPATPFTQAAHVITAQAVDAAGNPSATSAAKTVTVDLTAPAAPTISGLTAATDTGASATDNITADTTPDITGTAEANATIAVYGGGTLLGTTTANGAGAWTFTPGTALAAGTHTITATAMDLAGNVSAASAAKAVTIDPSAPAVPVITGLASGSDTGRSSTDFITSDTTPTIQGTAEAGVKVEIYDGAALLTTVTVDANGDWTYTPTLAEGSHAITAKAVDTAGGTSAATAVKTLVVDTTAPTAASTVVSGLTAATDTGASATDDLTNDPRPTIDGTAEANATVEVYEGATKLGSTLANGAGAWTFAVPTPFAHGAHTITAKAIDAAGNAGGISAGKAITIDMVAPNTPSISGLTAATDTGFSNTDGDTSDTTPALTGTAEANARIEVFDGTTSKGTTAADASGNWTFDFTVALAAGNHTMTVTATDAAGNVSAASAPFTVGIDSSVAAPVITGLDPASDTGASSTDEVTKDTRPAILGTAEGNTTITVKDGATVLGTTATDNAGAWFFRPATALSAGTHSITATTTDGSGNTSAASAPMTLTIDTTAPAAPAIDGLAPASDTGTSSTDGITGDTRPTIEGTAENNAIIQIYEGANVLGTTTASATGVWAYTPTAVMPAGVHTLTAKAQDLAGNIGPASGSYSFTIGSAPTTPVVKGVLGSSDTGADGADGVTSDTTPTMFGTGRPGAVLTIKDGGTTLGTVTVPGGGTWTYTTPVLTAGAHSITAADADVAGTVVTSAAKAITIDTAAPTVTNVTSSNANGTVNPGTKINVQVTFSEAVFVNTAGGVPTLTMESGTVDRKATYVSGSGGPTLTFEYFVHGGDSFTDLNYVATTSLALNGATIKDDAGNAATLTLPAAGAAGSLSANKALASGATLPTTPVIFGIGVNTGAAYDHDDRTTDTTPTLSGQATAGATVTIFEGATSKGTTVANATTGLWSFTFGTAQTATTHTYTAKVGTATSAGLAVTIDTAAPAAPAITGLSAATDTGTVGDKITSITTPTFTGTAEAGAFVTIKDGATTLGTVQAAGTTWSFTPTTALAAGSHGITATAKDAVGNVSAASASFPLTITTGTPATPVFTGLTAATDTGTSSTDRITSDTTPTFYGTASPGTTVQVFSGTTKLAGTQTMDASGNWTFTPTAAMASGIHAVTVRVADAAGNASAATAAKTVTIDGGAVTSVVAGLSPATDSGDSTIDNVTSITKPTIVGTASPNSAIEVRDGATVLGTTTANAAGDWSFNVVTALSQGTHSITAIASDTAGNTKTSVAKAITIDTTAPTVLSVSSTAAAGTYTVGDKIAIQVLFSEAVDVVKAGGVPTLLLETGATDRKAEYTSGSGTTTLTFTYTVQPGDTSADLNYVATNSLALNGGTIKDPAGTAAVLTLPATTAPQSLAGSEALVIDTTAPAVPVITGLTAATDTGTSSTDGVTSNTRPTLSGTAEANAKVNIFDGDSAIGPQVTANATGAWSFTPTTALTAGAHTLTARASDAAGNQSQASAAKTITIDATAPATPVFTGLTAATDSGSSDTDRTTNVLRPTLTGTAEAGARVEIFDGGTSIATVTADGSGAWSHTPAANMAVAAHAITVRATDLAGNVSGTSVAKTVTIDNVAPAQPVVTGITAATDTGVSNSDGITSNTRPVIQGTAEANAKVQIFDGATALGTTTASGAGAWTFTPATALANGSHSLTAKATDLAGNTSAASAAKSITIDAAIAAPVITGLTAATDTGASAIDGITKNATPTIVGTAEANATVTIKDGATTLGTATASGTGAWTFTPGSALAAGVHSLTATAGDTAGNASPASNTLIVQVDTTAPAAPVVAGLTAATDLGASSTDAITKATTPTIVGTAEPHATVVVKDGATTIGTVTADASGNWAITPATAFTQATHAITATATDVAGNVGAASAPKTVVVDTTAPATPGAPVLAAGSDTGSSATDGLTNDATPTLTGTTEAGATIRVFDGGTLLGTVVADGAGAWSFTTPTLATGAHSLAVTATDVAGNASGTSPARVVTVDTTAPATPTLAGLTAASDTGPSNTDGITSVATPTLTGTAEAGVTVQIRDGGTPIGTATASGAGAWTFTTPTLAAGPHALSAVAIDAAGNTSPSTPALPVFIDTAAPAAPVVLGLKPATDTGADFADAITANLAPTFHGTAEAGATVQVFDGATSLGTTTADAAGRWAFTPAAALAEGSHAITARATDAAGGQSPASAARTVILDATAPAAPTIAGLTAATDSGASSTDGLTRHATPTIQGMAEANVPVQIFDGATLLGTTTASGAGAWSFTPAAPLAAGAHAITARAVDLAGNASAASAALAVTIDMAAPAAPTIAGLTAATDTGASSTDGITAIATPTLVGTAEANATVTVYDGATAIGTATADAGGAWSFTPGAALAPGSHALSARATDAAGNQGGASAARTIVIDGGAPGAPTILGLTAATDTGASNTDGVTANATPTIVGTAEANAVVELFDNAPPAPTSLGTVTADATGAWSFTPAAPLAEGAHAITATARDAAGLTGAASSVFTVEIDATPAAAPVITGLAAGMDTGASATDGVTRIAKPTFAGTAEAGALVTIAEGATVLGVTRADGAGAWSFAAPASFAAGLHTVTATALDAAGQTSPASAGFTFTLDVSPPAAPTLAGITAATDSGASNTDGLTNVLRPVFTGTAEANATVRVFDGANEAGMTTADGAGAWSFTPSADLAAGAHTFTAVAEDLAGNRSASAIARTIVVDATPPAAPVVTGLTAATDSGTSNLDGVTGVVRPTIIGRAEPNATVEVFDGALSLGTATADGTGSWAFTPAAPLAEGAHAITARATDAAGNVSAASVVRTITIDTITGAAPVVTGLDPASDLGTSNADALTSSTRPTIVGTADPMSAVQVYLNDPPAPTLLGTTTADAAGNWAFTPPNALAAGAHGITAVFTDLVGNTSAASAVTTITIDTTAPTAPTLTGLAAASDTGISNNDGVTSVLRPTITGAGAEAGGTVRVFDGATLLGAATADGAGTWAFTPTTDLAAGTHTITAAGVDAAGNVSAASGARTIAIDPVAPAAPVVAGLTAATDTGLYAVDGITSNARPTITGTAEPGAAIQLFDGAAPLGMTTASASGTWAFTPATALGVGAHLITAVATDAAGNASATSAAAVVQIDGAAPAAPLITGLTAATDTGASATDGVTRLTTPTLAGTAEPNALVEVFAGATSLGQTAADGAGAWALPLSLAAGSHALTAVATDLAGLVSGASAAATVTVVTATPGAATLAGLTPASDAGASATDRVTSVAAPTFTGTAPAGTTVELVEAGTVLGTALVDGAGAWTLTPGAPLAAGTHMVAVRAVDLAGNPGALGPAVAVVIDPVAPAAPVVAGLTPATDTGASDADGVTGVATPTIVGTAEPGAEVQVLADATPLGTATADGTGAWRFTPAAPLAAGAHAITAVATDVAGNASPASAPRAIVIAAGAATAPTITGLAPGADTGASAVDGVTRDQRPAISGTAAPGAAVQVLLDGAIIGATSADAGGAWAFTPFAAVAAGTHVVTAVELDPAGVAGPASAGFTLVVDVSGPAAPVVAGLTPATDTGASATDGVTAAATPTVTGTTEANAIVEVFDGATSLGTTTADGTGGWAFTPAAPLAAGSHAVTAIATDLAGNASAASAPRTIVVDAAAPAAPVVAGLTAASDTGPSSTDGVTGADRPTIVGTAGPGEAVEVFDGAAPLGVAVADGAGAWAFTPAAALAAGEHELTAAVDGATGLGPASAPYPLTIDQAAPAAPAFVGLTAATDTGASSTDAVTAQTSPTIVGTADPGATIMVYDGQALLGTATADGAGDWSWSPGAPLAEGPHSLLATATDLAGNASAASAFFPLIVDATAPDAPMVAGLSAATDDGASDADGVTSDATPTIVGTAEAGATVEVFDGATSLGQAVADASGRWSLDVGADLALGSHALTARATDAAGNEGAASAATTLSIVAPGSSYRLGDDGGDGLWLGDFASGGTFTADLGTEPITLAVHDVLATPGAHDVLLAAVAAADAAATARDATQADLPIGAIPEAAPMLLPDQHLLVL